MTSSGVAKLTRAMIVAVTPRLMLETTRPHSAADNAKLLEGKTKVAGRRAVEEGAPRTMQSSPTLAVALEMCGNIQSSNICVHVVSDEGTSFVLGRTHQHIARELEKD